MSAIEDLIISGAASAEKGAIDSLVSRSDEKRKDRIWREHQDIAYKQQMAAARETLPNLVQGYKAAGLNPASAAGQSPMSIGGVAAPSGAEPHAGEMQPEFGKLSAEKSLMRKQEEAIESQKALNDSGVRKNDADASKSAEEARGLKQINDLRASENEYVDYFADDLIDQMIADAKNVGDGRRVKLLQALKDSRAAGVDGPFIDSSFLTALDKINKSGTANLERIVDYIQGNIKRMVAEKQIKSNATIKALANAPARDAAYVWKQIAAIDEQIKLTQGKEVVTDQQFKNLEQELINLGKEADKLDVETKKMFKTDVSWALDNGDYLGAGIKIAEDIGIPLLLFGLTRGRVPPVKASAAPAAPAAPKLAPVPEGGSPYSPTAKTGEAIAGERAARSAAWQRTQQDASMARGTMSANARDVNARAGAQRVREHVSDQMSQAEGRTMLRKYMNEHYGKHR